MLSYDAALCDATLQHAVIVLPTHEPFNDPYKDVLSLSLHSPTRVHRRQLASRSIMEYLKHKPGQALTNLICLSGFSKRKLLPTLVSGLWNLNRSSSKQKESAATPLKVGLLPRWHVSWLDGRMQGSVGERLAPTALPKILSTTGNALLPISQKGPDGVTHSDSVTGDKGGLCFLDLCGDRGSQRW